MARPRNEDRIDIKSRAVEVATRLFAERGVDGVTLQEIATEVGCRAPALYRYFESKEALLLAVHNDGFRRMLNVKLDAYEVSPSAFERLRLGGLAYVRFAMENPNLYDLMFNDRAPHRQLSAMREAGDPAAVDFADQSQQRLKQSILACQQEGYLVGLDPDVAAYTFWSVVHGAVSLALRQRVPFRDIDSTDIPERAVELMMELTSATRQQNS